MLVVRFRNWQGCCLFTQSLPLFSFNKYLSLKAIGFISRCAEMRLTSLTVNVGDIVLQQLAQVKQSTSFQTALSTSTAILSRSFGGVFSSLLKNLLSTLLYRSTFLLNKRRLIFILSLKCEF